MNPKPFTPSMPVPPSVASVETLRQAEVNAMRELRMLAHGGTVTAPDEPTDWRNILLLLTVIVWLVAGIVHLKAPSYQVLTLDSLEARIATLEAENVKLNNEIAAIEGNVEEKIEAWAMLEAQRIITALEGTPDA